jgi:2-polyprenyl-6-methoxyphenol hydroxylase-like FAD-dependent oxidoreductase
MATEVLIVGAGPTGLVLALWLAKLGVSIRIVDKSSGPGETSRAIAVHARTLELYRQLDLADDVVAGGIKAERLTIRREGRRIAQAELGDIGAGLSPFPFVLVYPQDLHERVLIAHLARERVQVERATELIALEQDAEGVRATLQTERGTETVQAAYVCGCDGAGSATRHSLGIDFPGGTYQQLFYVTDAIVSGEAATGGVQACVSVRDFCLVMPIRSARSVRLLGIVPPEYEQRDEIQFADVAGAISATTGLAIETVNWFSTYRVHHRVADRFHLGRAFLLGDAGHIHSPAGGQGMNTGIGDAVNLGWKLAAVVQGRAAAALLDTYEPERIAFARTLIVTTDRLFRLIASRSLVGAFWRTRVLPLVVPLALRLRGAPRLVFRAASQIRIRYRESALSSGVAGTVHGGDRLPWVAHDGADNFAPLRALDWQVHVYGTAGDAVRAAARARGLAVHEFPWSERADLAGLARDALYLVRPDGYVALAAAAQDTAALDELLSRFTVVPRISAAGAR